MHVHSKKNADISDRDKQDLVLLVPYDENDAISNSNENAHEKSSAEVQELANQLFPIKIKRDPDDGSKVILDYTDMIDSSKNEENTETPNKKKKPFYLVKKVENPKEVIQKLIQARKTRKNKRNAKNQDSIPIILGTNINNARNARSKKYMCLCREADCQGKRCYEHAQQENVDNTPAKEVDDINVGAYSEYTQQVIPTQPIPTIQPTKFNIPFANNVNFDQRVIVNNNEPDYSFYQKSTPYGIPLPKYIYNGGMPPQQNNAYATPTKTSSEDYVPSILGQNFGTVEECIKLYGRRFCLISSTTKPPFKTAQTIDLTHNKAVRTYSAETHDSNVGTYYSAITENPVLSHENEVYSQIQPAYKNEYYYQPMKDTTAEPILEKSVEKIQGTTIYIPDSATERLIDPRNAANIGIAKAPYQYQTECPSAPKYSMQTLRLDPKDILKEPITSRSLHTAVDSHIVNENEAAQRQYYEQTVQSQNNMEINDHHYTAGNSYVPNYSSNEMVQNKTYENMVSQQQMYDYAAYQAQQAMQAANLENSQLANNQFGSIVHYYNNQNIQQQQQQQLSSSYTADTSISKPTYSVQEVMGNGGYINNFENVPPNYLYTTGYPNQPGNNIQTENQATSQAPIYQPTPSIQYVQDRTQQTPPDSVATKHVHNFSSKEVIKNESYEDKVESSKVASTYSNINKNLPQTDQSAKDQNAKVVTVRSKNTANLDGMENAQQMQSLESHVTASSKYSNNYSSKEVTDSETYETNNDKQTAIDTQLSDNYNPELQNATTTTVASNDVKTPKSGARKTVQVYKYSRNKNPRLVRLTESKIATRSSNANLDASKKNIILKNYNINNNNTHPAEGYPEEYAEIEFLSTPKSLYSSAEDSDLITNRPLQVIQYHSNKNAQIVRLTGSNVETEMNYGDTNASNENKNNYATINENIVPVNNYPNYNYRENADTTDKSVMQSIPLYNNVGNNNKSPQLTKVSSSHFKNDGNTVINIASQSSVNNADYENNVDYIKPSYSYIPYNSARESVIQAIRTTTPIHETVESENVQQLKLTGSHYNNDNTYVPNYSSKELIENNIGNLNVPHVTESYQAVESDYAIHRPYNRHVPYNMGHVDNLNLNHDQSPTIYQKNENIQHVLPYISNNDAYSTNYHNSHENLVHAADDPNSETLTGQQSDTAEYYHYSNAQQETHEQYPTTNNNYMNHPIPHQSLSHRRIQPANVENLNSHSNKQRDANDYDYTNTQQGNYQQYPTTNSPFYVHSSNYQNSQQTLTHPPNIKNINIATYNEENIPKYYEYTDGNNPNANPTGSYWARHYNSAHNNFQMTATPRPYNNEDIGESIPGQSAHAVGYYKNENIGNNYVPNSGKQNINSNNYPSYDYSYDSEQNISPGSAVPNTNLDNTNSASNKQVKILRYHESDTQSPRPIYVYIPGDQNRSPNSPTYDSSLNNKKYSTTVKSIDYDDPIHDQDSSHKISSNNYETKSPTYNYIQNVLYNPSNIPRDDPSIHIDKSTYNQEHDFSAMPKEYFQPIISSHTPIFRIPQVANLQKQINIQSPPTYQIENTNESKPPTANIKRTSVTNNNVDNNSNPTKNSDELQYVTETVTTLEDVEDEEYKKHFNPPRIAKLRAVDNKIKEQIETKNSKNERHLSIKDSSLQLKKHESNAQVINQSSNTRMNKIAQAPQSAQDRAAYNEALFKGLEKIILQNDAVPDSPEHSYVESDKSSENVAQKEKSISEGAGVPAIEHGAKHIPQKSYGTETAIQSVDERPSVISEQDYDEANQYTNEAVLQSVVKKVINNLVPGKAQDLMANYETVNAPEIVGAGIEDLLPEIINNPALKNLFSLPEVENMITDTTSRLLTRLTGLPIIGQISQLIRNALHGVVDQIPRPHPTVAPMTVEEHKFKDGEWVTERVSLLESAPKVTDNPPREVLDKIKSIINRSALEEQSASQPVVENLIIKTVKYLLDEEKGVIDESTIRKAFNLVVHQSEQAPSTLTTVTREASEAMETTKPITPRSETTKPMDDENYKIAPIIPVTEHVIRNGQWYVAQNNLVGKKQNQNVGINEDKRKSLQEKLDILNKAKSEQQSVTYNTQQVHQYNSHELTEETMDQSIERKPIKYYSPNDRLLVYIKNHKSTDEPTTMGEIIGRTNEYDIDATTHPTGAKYSTSTKYNIPIVTENPANTFYHQQSVVQSNQQSEIIENNRNVNEYITSVKNYVQPLPGNPVPPNQLKMLVDPSNRVLNSDSQTQRSIKNHMEDRSETVKQVSNHLNLGQTLHLPGSTISQAIHQNEYPVGAPPSSGPQDVAYLGRLVPMDRRASQAKDLSELRGSNLVYVGDGVRLPLTIRRMQDGSFALTLSDEVCKRFIYKQCPCCLPSGPDGVIVRERRNRDGLLPQTNVNGKYNKYNINI